ncbi:DUF5644 domain-containing protein [Helicobacter turcicus]|uniref:DUF5644 domain-containing protein n=1 Tax=Helicobacter turcicus TaxID=2867412 RepID=A0ABS7JKU7_9HELI|nr:DUF5644 domain-containing protein [Helicobacter turcicus]MBX7490023.1 DUF5644 domain-containing protein [Helicobacter turcicus]MBX7544882.1 DUF5644 domain-containing protein [Helicobacter turcicus]
MEKKINLELFRFDVKTDYLPYFAKLTLKVAHEKSLLDLLKMIQNFVYDYGYNAYGFKINGVVVFDFELPISRLLKRFGSEWRIEPLNTHLALKDLIINIEPFLNKLEPLKQLGLDELARDEVLSTFKNADFKEISIENLESRALSNAFLLSFLPFAYATPLSVENPNYLSEAYFLLAAALYAKHKTDNILEAVSDGENGILNAQALKTYLFPQDDKFDICIDELKTLIFNHCENPKIQKFKARILKSL